MYRRPRRRAALVIALSLLLAGCASAVAEQPAGNSGSAAPTRSEAPPTVSATPVLDSANDKPLPLDGYLLAPDQLLTVEKAQARLISGCMARFGFDYTPPAPALPGRDSDAPTTRIDGRYGRQSAALLAKWGYHPEGGAPAAADSQTQPPMSPAMTVAARGTSDPKQRFGPGGQTVNGLKVPDHGCVGEAAVRLTGSVDGQLGDAKTASDLKFGTLEAARVDPRTQAVFAKWSQCMRAAGLDYADPLAAMSDKEWSRTPLPTPHELQVATADAGCRHRENVVGVWYAVDAAYQQQAIAEHAPAMADAKAALAAQLKAATQALAG
ncbi:hypothetical protein [Kitasatospora sp. NPDC059571]|uniref:hypothetical protein n=1 Tax=Kitasatospora sp. NPDC059571 TaxID=3346871 RepID=UPI0036CA06A9